MNTSTIEYVKIEGIEYVTLESTQEILSCMIKLKNPIKNDSIYIDVTDYMKEKLNKGMLYEEDREEINEFIAKATMRKSNVKVYKENEKYNFYKIEKIFK